MDRIVHAWLNITITYIVKLGVCWIYWSFAQIIFQTGFAKQGVHKEDPTVLVDGARPPSVSLIMSLTNSWLNKLGPHETREGVNHKMCQWLIACLI